jgi:hypothetical protein
LYRLTGRELQEVGLSRRDLLATADGTSRCN